MKKSETEFFSKLGSTNLLFPVEKYASKNKFEFSVDVQGSTYRLMFRIAARHARYQDPGSCSSSQNVQCRIKSHAQNFRDILLCTP